MKTIALRFGEHFAPDCGTIAAHQVVIDKLGFVWYGKMGAKVSLKNQKEIMSNNEPRILLIRSGKAERYWAYISNISNKTPIYLLSLKFSKLRYLFNNLKVLNQ